MSTLTTTNELLDTLYDWIVSVAKNRTVIISNLVDGNAPNKPYVAFRLVQSPTSQNPVTRLSADGLNETIVQQCLFTVNVECVGDYASQTFSQSAHATAIELASSLNSANRFADLWGVCGLGGVTIGPQSLTTAMLGTNRTRWQFQFTIYALIAAESEGQYFDKGQLVVIEGTKPTVVLDTQIDGDNPPHTGECNGNE